MKFTIDEDICKAKGISTEELLAALLIKTGVDIPQLFESMERNCQIVKTLLNGYMLTKDFDTVCMETLLSSEKDIPTDNELQTLAKTLMEIFPAGKKPGAGTSTYWRGNVKDVTLKLKKFFKLYGNYTTEQIVEATRAYVKSFNGDYKYMRVLKHFIWKDERKVNSEGVTYIEEVSDLATFIANKEAGEDTTTNSWNLTLV